MQKNIIVIHCHNVAWIRRYYLFQLVASLGNTEHGNGAGLIYRQECDADKLVETEKGEYKMKKYKRETLETVYTYKEWLHEYKIREEIRKAKKKN